MFKNKSSVNIFYVGLFFALIVPTLVFSAEEPFFKYKLMESLPLVSGGQAGDTINLTILIVGFYKLLLWLVTIGAVFMISVGAFYYMTAGGNTSNVTTAKKIIGDSFLGLMIALTSWLMLYIINPDLVKNPQINFFKANNKQPTPTTPITSTTTPTNWPTTPYVPSTDNTGAENIDDILNTIEDPDYCSDQADGMSQDQDTSQANMCYTPPDYIPAEYPDYSANCLSCQTFTGVECQNPPCKALAEIASAAGIASTNIASAFTTTTINLDGTTTTKQTAKLVVTKTFVSGGGNFASSSCYSTGSCADVQVVSMDPSVNAVDPVVVQRAYQAIKNSTTEVVTYHSSNCAQYSSVGVSCIQDGGDYFKIGS